jgi:hypothetical protein
MQSNKPTNHIRIVKAGISGSSILDTEARTSGYGLSSSSIASKSNSILGVGVVSIQQQEGKVKPKTEEKNMREKGKKKPQKIKNPISQV